MDHRVIVDNLHYFLLGAWPDGPLGGAALTVLLSVVSALASAVLGLAGGIALSLLHGRWRVPLLAVLGFFRAIPILLLIFWIYFLLPVLFGVDVPGVLTVVVALSLVGGAYLAHSVAAGITSLPPGQWQAAQALGLGRAQSLRLVVLPQALPVMLPSFVNQWIALVKDTSLAYIIGVAELSFVATQVSNRVMVHPTEIFLFAAAVYFVLCACLEAGAHRLAARWQTAPSAA
ncbi:MAG: amino acid ABC transporter permease [Luteimonas sp.]